MTSDILPINPGSQYTLEQCEWLCHSFSLGLSGSCSTGAGSPSALLPCIEEAGRRKHLPGEKSTGASRNVPGKTQCLSLHPPGMLGPRFSISLRGSRWQWHPVPLPDMKEVAANFILESTGFLELKSTFSLKCPSKSVFWFFPPLLFNELI